MMPQIPFFANLRNDIVSIQPVYLRNVKVEKLFTKVPSHGRFWSIIRYFFVSGLSSETPKGLVLVDFP
jgi:hypothetical protein